MYANLSFYKTLREDPVAKSARKTLINVRIDAAQKHTQHAIAVFP